MVFLHGGGFTYGAAGVPLYEGEHLASRGVVLVTMNYRLGLLGFFAHPALTKEDPNGELGNYGVMDQVAALRWVQRNVAQFGGDPKNVTVFGESAGAGVVQILMASPGSAGLFEKAVSESGSGFTALPPIRGGAGSAETTGARWAEGLGLKDATPAQLRAIPVAEIIKARGSPFIDGKVIVQSPGVGFYQHKDLPIPLIIGSNSNEGSLIGNNAAIARPILGADYADLLAAYEKRPGFPPKAAALDLAEDVASVLESMWVGQKHVDNGGKTYAFYFDQVPVDQRPGTLGTEHGGEIEYLFGNRPVEHRWDATDEKVSKLMGDYWVRFAKTGNPNAKGAPEWPAVTTQPTAYLDITADTHATKLTPLEQKAQARTFQTALKLWAAELAH
jgi:para-nitrobenzyl esterase